MASIGPGKASTTRRLRRACFVLLAVAVFFSGLGAGHAAMALPADGMHQAHGVVAASPEQPKCHDQEAPPEKSPMSQLHDLGGCCVNACSPSAIPRDVLSFTPTVFDIEKLQVSTDQAPALTAPAGLFRPPRSRALPPLG